jgi:2-aminobenzoate-CoA ligase
MMLGPSCHVDTFARDRLPPVSAWPAMPGAAEAYPEYINAAVELTDRMVERGFGERIALIGAARRRTYRELSTWTNRLAHALVDDLGVRPGNRILIRSANTPAMVACWLAATKVGAVVVNTMPMLRALELDVIIEKAEVGFALCDTRLVDELQATGGRFLERIVGFDGTDGHDAELDRLALGKPGDFDAVRTGRDDVALLGFTSGTTGVPKATMHFHRDILAIADGYAKDILQVRPDDIFVGSPPLAFTFGLGGLAVFPLRFGAAAALFETATPPHLLDLIQDLRATICFTAPTAYRAMLAAMGGAASLPSLRVAVASGETLPAPVFQGWTERTGVPLLECIGSTEMLHAFISNRLDDHGPGRAGRPVRGYEARVVDEAMREVPRGTAGRLAVRGPTGCRYLDDPRQGDYVRDGWNITGDTFINDEDGYFRFVARNDDMIVSAGYNIAAPEVEAALLAHGSVRECAVIGARDPERGHVVQAFIVLENGYQAGDALVRDLQDHVKSRIAAYKYPRSIRFIDELPKTLTGKIRHAALRGTG